MCCVHALSVVCGVAPPATPPRAINGDSTPPPALANSPETPAVAPSAPQRSPPEDKAKEDKELNNKEVSNKEVNNKDVNNTEVINNNEEKQDKKVEELYDIPVGELWSSTLQDMGLRLGRISKERVMKIKK